MAKNNDRPDVVTTGRMEKIIGTELDLSSRVIIVNSGTAPIPNDDTFNGRLADSLKWGSSELDWCENNFVVTSHITEFWNTISNVPFFILPPILIYLFREYGKRLSCGIHLVWVLFLVIGTGSAYFHATLSLFGQLWDELGILWVIMAACAFWLPKDYIPTACSQSRLVLQMVVFAFTIVFTGLSTLIPCINNIVLFSLTIPSVYVFYKQHKKWSRTNVSRYQAVLTLTIFSMAATCWVSDQVFCDLWKKLSFQYLHAVWHVLIALSSYRACVMLSYYHALEEVSDVVPSLKLWPENCPQLLAIPYVEFGNINNKLTITV